MRCILRCIFNTITTKIDQKHLKEEAEGQEQDEDMHPTMVQNFSKMVIFQWSFSTQVLIFFV